MMVFVFCSILLPRTLHSFFSLNRTEKGIDEAFDFCVTMRHSMINRGKSSAVRQRWVREIFSIEWTDGFGINRSLFLSRSPSLSFEFSQGTFDIHAFEWVHSRELHDHKMKPESQPEVYSQWFSKMSKCTLWDHSPGNYKMMRCIK